MSRLAALLKLSAGVLPPATQNTLNYLQQQSQQPGPVVGALARGATPSATLPATTSAALDYLQDQSQKSGPVLDALKTSTLGQWAIAHLLGRS
jgi:hypothetical protein